MVKHIRNINKSKVFLIFCLIQMSLIIGLRYEVGADYYSYENIYRKINSASSIWNIQANVEVGYLLLNRILGIMGISYYGLNLCMAFMTHYFVIKAIAKAAIDPFLGIYMYISFFFFYHSMNQTRQGLAMAIGLYAIVHLFSDDKNKGFILFVVLGSLFHMSVLILLPLVFLKKVVISKKIMLIYILGTFGIGYGFNLLFKLVSYTKYAVYINSSYNVQGLASSRINFIIRFVMLLLVLYRFKSLEDSNRKNILYHMVIICTGVQYLTTYYSIFGRVTTPFFMAYIILIPDLINAFNFKYRQIVYYGCVIMASIYQYVYYILMQTSVLVNDYKFFLFH